MGYGGIFKSVIRIAIPIAVSFIPGAGPLAVALSSAAATGATGGSFKEALVSAGTSYIGASISQSVNASVAAGSSSSAANIAASEAGSVGLVNGVPTVFNASGNVVAAGKAATEAINAAGSISQGFSNLAANANDAVTGTVSQFAPDANSGFGGFLEGTKQTFKSGFDVIRDIGDVALNPLGASLGTAAGAAPSTVLGSLAGGATTLTLNQALLAGTAEADALLNAQGYTPQQIELLRQEARNALSQQAFDRISTDTVNPFIKDGQDEQSRLAAEEEFKKVIASGIEQKNTALGTDVTKQQFDAVFNSPTIGNDILNTEKNLRIGGFTENVNSLFNGSAFNNTLDDKAIANILDQQQGPAFNEVARFEARGNLNALGGQTAKNFISSQRGDASTRLNSIGNELFSNKQRNIDEIKNKAIKSVNQYQLGDGAFDLSPFKTQRNDIISNTTNNIEGDIRKSLGSEQLFNARSALTQAGGTQGLVSGAPSNANLLDTLAARASGNNRKQRGLGSRGSGVF